MSPVVAWLCHEDCPVSGEVFAVGGGRVARVFVGRDAGVYTKLDLTTEDVAEHADQIMDESGYVVPADVAGARAHRRRARQRLVTGRPSRVTCS